MVRRSLSLSLRLLGSLLAAALILALLLVWRLASGPLALDPLTPYVESALTPRDAPLTVEIGGTQLRLDRAERSLELVVTGLRTRGPDGARALELPEVEVDLSLRALLQHGAFAPRRLAATAPSLALVRTPDGRIGISGVETAGGAVVDLRVLAGAVLGEADPARPLTFLDELVISGGRLSLRDARSGQSLDAADAELTMARDPAGLDARLAFLLRGADHTARVTASGAIGTEAEHIDLAVQFADLSPGDLAGLMPPLPFDPAGLELRLNGRIQTDLGLDGTFSEARLYLEAGPGSVDLPGLLAAELPVGSFRFQGRLADDQRGLEIESLDVATLGATLAAEGRLAWRDGGLSSDLRLKVADVRADDLARFWPPEAGDAAREWVTEHVSQGTATSGEARLRLEPGDLGRKPLRDEALGGRFAFRDLTVRYFKDLPPLTGVEGSATFTGQTMDFTVDAGGVDRLELESGSVSITGIGVEGRYTTQLEVDADIVGPLADALALIDHEPLGFARKLGLDPAAASGSARTDLEIGLPLYRQVQVDDLRVAAEAQLEDAAVSGLLGRFDVEAGQLELSVGRESMTITGDARVDGIPLAIEWQESFDDEAPTQRRYRLRGSVDATALERFGWSPPVPLEGAFGLDASGRDRDGRRDLDLDLDLEPLALALPPLDWQKERGEPGTLELALTLTETGLIAVDSFTFAAAGLEAAGSLELGRDPAALQRLDLERLALGDQQGSATVRTLDAGGYRVSLRAASLDLKTLFERLGDERPDDEKALMPLELDVRAERVQLPGRPITDLSGSARRGGAGWRTADLRATLPEGGEVTLVLAPRDGAADLTLRSSDAGELLRTLDQTRRIEGGAFVLRAEVTRQVPDLKASGTLNIDDFTVLDAPILARLLTLASLTGIGNLLEGDGVHVDQLEIPFRLGDGVLTLEGGRLSGSQIGLTMDGEIDLDRDRLDLRGTIVPIFALNQAIGRIPIIGDFLTGSEGEGAFAATYTITGPRDDPEVAVNPLSVLTPGFIRELLGGILSGTLEPPEIPDTDR